MAFKIALFAALCVAQVFAFKPWPQAFARETAHNFDEEFYPNETITKDIVIECLGGVQNKFDKFADNVVRVFAEAFDYMDPELKEKVQSQIDLIAEPLEDISNTLREFPSKMYSYVKDSKLGEAGETILVTRSAITEKKKVIRELLQQMAEAAPELEESISELTKDMKYEFIYGEKVVRDFFSMCVYMAGYYE